MDNTDEAVTHALNFVSQLGLTLVGAFVGLFVASLLLLLIGPVTKKHSAALSFRRRTAAPLFAALGTLGALVGYRLTDIEDPTIWYGVADHALLILLIVSLGWFFYAAMGILHDLTQERIKRDSRDAQRLQTQAQVLQRVLQATVVVGTIVSVLLTFPGARAPLASLLGAAGVLSVVTGLAAQSTLGNMFAGIQLAFTDAIRVGDTVTVQVGSSEEIGTVEELTLTYVVVRIWNKRRILLPSGYFTTKPFENWTRRGTDQIGKVEFQLDWPVPVDEVRRKAHSILEGSPLWDRETWNVQVTEIGPEALTLRVVASAATAGDRWDLECELREQLAAWVSETMPWAIPHLRAELETAPPGSYDTPEVPAPEEGDEPAGRRLYSGSKAAESLRQVFAGPGEEVMQHRDQTAVAQALDARGEAYPGDKKEDEGKESP